MKQDCSSPATARVEDPAVPHGGTVACIKNDHPSTVWPHGGTVACIKNGHPSTVWPDGNGFVPYESSITAP